jgi:hypothetical protein
LHGRLPRRGIEHAFLLPKVRRVITPPTAANVECVSATVRGDLVWFCIVMIKYVEIGRISPMSFFPEITIFTPKLM